MTHARADEAEQQTGLRAEPKRGSIPSPERDVQSASDDGETPRGKAPTAAPDGQPSATPEQPPSNSSRSWTRRSLFALVPLALIAGGYWYVTGGQIMSTDDAYVEADKVGISTDVSGVVQEVAVSENQHVRAGQVLYQLDPRQFQIALNSAKANLAETELTVNSMKQDYRRMLRDIDAQQAQVELDQATYDRDDTLLKTDAVPRASYDQARFTLQADQSKVASLKQQAEVQLARLGGNPDVPVHEHPQYLQAEAQVAEAQRQLDHTIAKAPFAGIVTDVPSIAPGKYMQASMTAFFLVATDHVWVDANPKETELTYVQWGQPVRVTLDTFPGLEWHGSVESISPAAAQEFQLLPAQNTSGNWVKVVQRIPVRVRVDTRDGSLPQLRAGMSVEIAVDTGHARGVPQVLAGLFGHKAARA